MRLIDADEVKDLINSWDSLPFEEEVDDLVDRIPTAYDVDKVVEQLEKLADELEEKALTMNKAECFDFANGLLSKAIGVRDAIGIVKAGGIDD